MERGARVSLVLGLLLAACSKPTASTTTTASATAAVSTSPPAATSAVEVPSDAGPPAVLESGKSIGPIRLGMTRAEVEGLGLPTSAHPSLRHGPNVRRVGHYRLVYDDGKVSSVEVNLVRFPGSVRIGTQDFDKSSDPRDIAAALPACKDPQQGAGGTVIECDGGRTLIKMMPRCNDYDDAGVCTGYDPRRLGLELQVLGKATAEQGEAASQAPAGSAAPAAGSAAPAAGSAAPTTAPKH